MQRILILNLLFVLIGYYVIGQVGVDFYDLNGFYQAFLYGFSMYYIIGLFTVFGCRFVRGRELSLSYFSCFIYYIIKYIVKNIKINKLSYKDKSNPKTS